MIAMPAKAPVRIGSGVGKLTRYVARVKLIGAAIIANVGLALRGREPKNTQRYKTTGSMIK